MGASGSKENQQKKSKQNENNINDQKNIEIYLKQQKEQYEEKYERLVNDHQKLQQEFIELKTKYDQDIREMGDFASHANEVHKKLQDALREREIYPTTAEIGTNVIKQDLDGNHYLQNKVDCSSYYEEINYNEKIENVQKELDKILIDNVHKDVEIDELKKQLEETKIKFDEEKNLLKEEFTTKGLLLCERYEEEKKQMNAVWEQKLTETINKCNHDITNFRLKLNKEKLALEEKLENAENALAILEKKNKILNNMFEDIQLRYESRESKLEDLERIADLEGQLIIQAEELEKQKELLKNIKIPNDNCTENASGNVGRRSKKNARKRKKRSQLTAKC